jgi:peptidoglycan/LPS O-acetylase OafA/YrhL
MIKALKYRPEIDGLRALAVLPVIFFHAGFEIFRGGFIGVDVFFVISGYLITTLIYQDLASGSFSIVNFYERRARRILPVLYLVLIISVPFAWIWLQPNDLKDYSQSLAAVSLFSSNILFWRESGYFDTAAELKPLLHTWSLSVEEQYYLIIPLLMYVLWRDKTRFFIVLGLLFLVSLLGSEWAATRKPAANFFLLPSRAWELLIGAFCALYLLNEEKRIKFGNLASEILGITGLSLILFSIFAYSKNTPFPSFYALIPTLGAALIIIFAHPNTIAGKLLSSKYIVGLGLISYSAYLLHQPIFAFARHRSLGYPSIQLLAGLSLLSLTLAYFSWKYIETPFRQRGVVSRRAIFAFSIAGSAVLFSIGLYGHLYSNDVKNKLSWMPDSVVPTKFKGIVINGVNCSGRNPKESCQLYAGQYDQTLIVIGDSHARVLTQPIYDSLQSSRIRLIDLTSSGCPFLPGLNIYINGIKSSECNSETQNGRLAFLKTVEPSIIILHSRLPLYIHGSGFDNGIGGKELHDPYYASKSANSSIDERAEEIRESFIQVVDQLRSMGHRIVIVGPIPPTGWDPIGRLFRIERFGMAQNYDDRYELMKVPHKSILDWNGSSIKIIEGIVNRYPDLIYINPDSLSCSNGYCASITKDKILYTDTNHLSLAGSDLLYSLIQKRLSDSPPETSISGRH